ncbi:thioesterase II family protein [Nocardia sp. NPDC004068]|uniref:thioesterase II family protein n=1 Tax=Nocardia sp. NPDC004068 TaxID=3364303 RepID=UPI003679CE7C
MRTPWYRLIEAAAPTRRLVCFPHAGASAGFYRSWADHVDPGTELCLIQYPARQERLREPMPDSIAELGGAIAAALRALPPLPTVLFGHSMGGFTAFETVRADRESPWEALVLSAAPAPGLRRPVGADTLGDRELVARLDGLSEAEQRLLTDPELGPMFLRTLRADLRLLDRYEIPRGEPIDVPLACFVADADPVCAPSAAAGWERFSRIPLGTTVFAGSHLYLAADPAAVVAAALRVADTAATNGSTRC